MQQGFTPKRSGARQGCLHKITLCIRRFGLFFSGTSGTVEVVGVQRLFALRAGKALSHRRHEDGFVPYVRLDCKKCDRKKQQKGRCGEVSKKTSEALRYEGRGFLLPEDGLFTFGAPFELFYVNPNYWH